MKKSILSLIFTLGIIASYAQTVTSGVALRVNDTTTYQAQQVIRHSQGYSDVYWNNQATTPHFDIWNGSSYDHVFDFNAGGGGGSGTVETIVAGNLIDVDATDPANPEIDVETGDKGDITIGANSLTIDNGAVTGAKIASGVALAGSPTTTTQSANTNNTTISTTAYVDAKVEDNITNGATTTAPSENAVFDALALKGDLHRAITTKTANHVLEAADDGTTILMNVASTNTVTIPSGVFATGTEITVHQIGAGQTTFVLSGVTATPTAGTGVLTLSGGGFAVVKFTGSSTCIIYNGSPALQVTSGTYTPTLTNSANLGASTARLCGYTRVGDRVTVTGQLDIDPTTTATLTTLGISLPVASNFTTVYQAGGAASAIAVADASAGIQADATNDRVTLQYVCTDVTNHAMTFTFTYTVL